MKHVIKNDDILGCEVARNNVRRSVSGALGFLQNQCEKETTLKELEMQQRREERKVVHLTNQSAQNKHEALTQMLIQQQQQEQQQTLTSTL